MKYPYHNCKENIVFFLRQVYARVLKKGYDLNKLAEDLGLVFSKPTTNLYTDKAEIYYSYLRYEAKPPNILYELVASAVVIFNEMANHNFDCIDSFIKKLVQIFNNKADNEHFLLVDDTLPQTGYAVRVHMPTETGFAVYYSNQFLRGAVEDITFIDLINQLIKFYKKNVDKLGYWTVTNEYEEKSFQFIKTDFGKALLDAGLLVDSTGKTLSLVP